MAKDVRYSDVFKNSRNPLRCRWCLDGRTLPGGQNDTIIRVETKVDQIQMEQTEMRHDLKHIIHKLDGG